MSGLKAAQDLSASGYTVTVLEARNRIGGRTWTDQSLGVPLDMGGSWIHGITGNPIHELAQSISSQTVAWDYDRNRIFDESGSSLPLSGTQMDRAENEIQSAVNALSRSNPNASVQAAIDRAASEGAFSGLNQAQIDFIVASEIEGDFALDSRKLSIQALLEGENVRGGDVVLKDGYVSLVNHLADGLDIQLGQVVTAVDYNQQAVQITTNSGNFEADYVVVTVPLGVLKNGSINFSPVLSQSKIDAIETMEMGVLNKVYLRFPSQFWDLTLRNFGLVKAPKGTFPFWIDQQQIGGEPIIGGLITGDFALDLEQKTDAEIVSEAMEALRSMFGTNISNPTDFTITRWMDDPYSYGSYSQLAVGARPEMRQDLGQSVSNKLFFAGEATDAVYPSTVHGAYESGARVAQSISSIAG